MKLSLGIMAWNESEIIAASLKSLFDQSLLKRLPDWNASLEIIIVPNGCKDNTEEVARIALSALAAAYPPEILTWKVVSLEEAGKTNAWNHYIHVVSNPCSDYVILMDADITFLHPDTLVNMVTILEQNPEAIVSTDLPQKHVLFKKHKSILDRISLAIGQMTQAAPGQITGQLYCARGPFIRGIYMPPGLMVDDGFIKFMVCTDLFRKPLDNRRVVRAPNASHVFESYTGVRDVFYNQRRQQIAHTVYTYLRDYLNSQVGTQNAAEIIRDNNARNPDWYRALIRQQVEQGGWWVMYPGALTVRFKRLANLPLAQFLLKLPVACVGFLMDAVVLVAANTKLKSGQLKGVWKDTKSNVLAQISSSLKSG
jgi:glycosyltransferase involved in cell wall biosynthesis